MKKISFIKIVLALICFSSILILETNAEELESGSYRIVDFSSGSLDGDRPEGVNYSLSLSSAEVTADDRFYSGNYGLEVGVNNTWKASVPKPICAETDTTSAETTCEDSDIVPGGMIGICGGLGCYDKARFEIDGTDNPLDTLYSVQITTDPSWSSFDFIDAATFIPEPLASHTINDYQTEQFWEGTISNFNILGLEQNTTYYVRFTALSGSFTETRPGPSISFTTSIPSIIIDLDIAQSSTPLEESPTPYTLDIGGLTTGTVTESSSAIWLDLESNSNLGVKIYVTSLHAGLYSSTNNYTIPSANLDLSTTSGVGLQNSYLSQITGGLNVFSDFTSGGEVVGGVPNTLYSKELLSTNSQPLTGGRAGFTIKARPAQDTPSAIDYTDTYIFSIGIDI